MARYNYKNGNRVNYELDYGNITGSINELSRTQAENLLLDAFFANLTSPKSAHTSLQPLDVPISYIKDVAQAYGTPTPSVEAFSETEPWYQDGIKSGYSMSVAGIGPFALNTPHHVLTQSIGLKMLMPKRFSRLGKMGTLKDSNGVHTLAWLSAMISAHVDVANEDYILQVNIGPFSYNHANFLLRSGVGRNALLFINQDVFKNLALANQEAAGTYGQEEYSSFDSRFDKQKKDIINAYISSAKKIATPAQLKKLEELLNSDGKMFNDDLFFEQSSPQAPGRLEKTYLNKAKGKDFDYYYDQIYYSKLWDSLDPYASAMSDLVMATQVDTKKFGNNAVAMYDFLDKYNSLLYSPYFRKEDIESMYKDLYFDKKVDNSVKFLLNILGEVSIPSKEGYNRVYRKILGLLNIRNLKGKSNPSEVTNGIDAVWKSKALLNSQGYQEIIPGDNATEQLASLRNLFFGENSMSRRLNKLKNDILLAYAEGKDTYPEIAIADGRIENMLLNRLSGREMPNKIEYLKVNASDDSVEIISQMKGYWQELLDSTNPELRQFAKDLVRYAIFTGHGMQHMNNLFSYIPDSALEDTLYYDKVRQIEKMDNDDFYNLYDAEDLDEFFRNNWSNNRLVPFISTEGDGVKTLHGSMQIPRINEAGEVVFSPKRVIHTIIGSNKKSLTFDQDHQLEAFHPFVKLKTNNGDVALYKNVGVMVQGTGEKVTYKPVYVLTNKKGHEARGKAVITEYLTANTLEDGVMSRMSILPGNNMAPVELYQDGTMSFIEDTNFVERVLSPKKNAKGEMIQEVPGTFRYYNMLNKVDDAYVDPAQQYVELEDVVEENLEAPVGKSLTDILLESGGSLSRYMSQQSETETSTSEDPFADLTSGENFNNESEFPSDTMNHCKN